MKKDCSKTQVYFSEKNRMCNSISVCRFCPFSYVNNGMENGCNGIERQNIQRAIEIVQKWSDSHPRVTILEDYLCRFPNAGINGVGTPYDTCPYRLGYEEYGDRYCSKTRGNEQKCIVCWNRYLDEIQKENE